ncbi:DUF2759 domain-containing protein [Salinicoccus roseus]|uniref:DUF2759 domain-containing protein n=1 Tax=Salinicoccus roseus TaxID=45670 RepID=A0A265E937_9STAP|nr:DUF2759 domain-containing protein [Salinicoccus roseus]OZT78104.1 hypothetical protein CFN03_02140 [Salinicoccus roseus]RPE54174.1 uncharacterized protein DUF2759 [Salinicoccus roseus]GGA67670.1 hypothetical protein GCM10007176_10080 [Salinicoccus roseus]
MPFIDTGELFEIGGITIHIGVNAFSVLMLMIAIVGVWGLVAAVKNRNLLAVLFSFATVITFGFFAIATIFTYGYPDLAH